MKNFEGHQEMINVNLDRRPSDAYSVVDLETPAQDFPEADQTTKETTSELETVMIRGAEDEDTLFDEKLVSQRGEFLNKKLAFFEGQRKRLGVFDPETYKARAAEDEATHKMSLAYLEIQEKEITPLLEAFNHLDDAKGKLTQFKRERNTKNLSQSEDTETDEILGHLESNIEQAKLAIINFDMEGFNEKISEVIEKEKTRLQKELDRKMDEVALLKDRLFSLGATEENYDNAAQIQEAEQVVQATPEVQEVQL